MLQIPYLKNSSEKKKFYFKKFPNLSKLPKNEKVLKFFYFHILNIAMFGYIYVWMIAN